MQNDSLAIKYAAYCRKSTDDERQVLSLDSQDSEIKRKFGNLKIVSLEPESVSAFKPYKRPVFKKLMEMIDAGKIQGIVAWHPDRLSRNPIDAAQIIYFLDIGKLKDLKFCSYTFENSPEGKMFLQMTMAQSKHSSDKLSKDVKRGMDTKAATGFRPGRAGLGYLNSNTNIRGKETIFNDPDRFKLVKQLWQIMLTGNYSVPAVLKIANEDLHLTQPATKKLPERPLTLNVLYRLFTNNFYYGFYEWPNHSGNWIKGEHQPMITEAEFDLVQEHLGRKGRPRPKEYKFAFTGLMRCGSCGGAITAEEKWKHQKNGNVHHYIYYRCTKKTGRHCPERFLNLEEFNKQVDELLGKITVTDRFKNWAIKHLHEIRKEEAQTQEDSLATKQRLLNQTVQQLDNLLLKYTSPENVDGSFISDQEYQMVKGRLIKQKTGLEAELREQGRDVEQWIELSERTFNFCRYARMWFEKGDLETKRAIFACLGSDLLLKDKKVGLTLKKPFQFIFEGLSQSEQELARLAPLETAVNNGQHKDLTSQIVVWSG